MAEATDAVVPVKTLSPDRWSTMMARRLSPLAWKRFIPNEAQAVTPIKLADAEVQNKCFAVLGYLEEYYLPSSSDIAEVKTVDLSAEAAPATNETARRKSGLQQLEEQLDSVLEIRPGADVQQSGQRHQQLKHRLLELLAIPQVRERFETEFNAELPLYQAARGPMRQVRDIDRITSKLRRAIYKRYLDDKGQHGKLTQSSVDQIYFFQGKLGELGQQKEGIEDTASPATLGYLETQKLLDYKRQLREKGFVMTPSRKHLIDRITREALAGKKIFLVGSTGTGKTQLAFYALNNLTGGYELINWHEGTTPRDLFGYRELWTDELGGVQSGMKPGPIPKALGREKQVGVIHEEYTGGSTRTQLAAKFMMGARPGDRIQIPGFNGQVFDVTNNFIEIFTGNPKDERTKQREDMDPAILRELTGVEISYMSAHEMNDIVRTMLIEENGVLKLNPAEGEYVDRLAKAAEMMQRIHNRDFAGFSTEMKTLLGIDAQGNTDTTLNTNFLDPGTLFKLFGEWELASARGQSFESYMEDKLGEFVTDPKTLSAPEERRTLQKILHAFGLITSASGDVRVTIAHQDKSYILPSEMAGNVVLSSKNPMDNDKAETSPPSAPAEIQQAERIFGEDFFGVEKVEHALNITIAPEHVPNIPFSLEELERAKELGQYLILRVDKDAVGTPLTMKHLVDKLQPIFTRSGKGKILYKVNLYPKEPFYTTSTPRLKWSLTSKTSIPNSENANYLQQAVATAEYLKTEVFRGQTMPSQYQAAIAKLDRKKSAIADLIDPNSSTYTTTWKRGADQLAALEITKLTRQLPVEVIYDFLVYFQNTNDERLLESLHAWTAQQTRAGSLVTVGNTDADGALVNKWHPGHSHANIRAFVSR